jgi:hypothetical protein
MAVMVWQLPWIVYKVCHSSLLYRTVRAQVRAKA